MKFILSLLVLTNVAMANDAKLFVGKFKLPADDNCSLTKGNREASSAYTSLQRHKFHKSLLSLDLSVFSKESDTTGEMYLLESGSFRTLGTSEDVHGKVTDTVVAKWINSKKIVTSITTKNPKRNYERTMTFEISANSKGIAIRTFGESGKIVSSCNFLRQ